MELFIEKHYSTSLSIQAILVWLCLLPSSLKGCQLLCAKDLSQQIVGTHLNIDC